MSEFRIGAVDNAFSIDKRMGPFISGEFYYRQSLYTHSLAYPLKSYAASYIDGLAYYNGRLILELSGDVLLQKYGANSPVSFTPFELITEDPVPHFPSSISGKMFFNIDTKMAVVKPYEKILPPGSTYFFDGVHQPESIDVGLNVFGMGLKRNGWGIEYSNYSHWVNLEIVSPDNNGDPVDTDGDDLNNEQMGGDALTLSADISGKCVLIQRGGVVNDSALSFMVKARNAQTAGAKMVIVYNRNDASNGGTNNVFDICGNGGNDIKIPVLFISNTAGETLLTAIRAENTRYASFFVPNSTDDNPLRTLLQITDVQLQKSPLNFYIYNPITGTLGQNCVYDGTTINGIKFTHVAYGNFYGMKLAYSNSPAPNATPHVIYGLGPEGNSVVVDGGVGFDINAKGALYFNMYTNTVIFAPYENIEPEPEPEPETPSDVHIPIRALNVLWGKSLIASYGILDSTRNPMFNSKTRFPLGQQ
jgi:hypothetical protein